MREIAFGEAPKLIPDMSACVPPCGTRRWPAIRRCSVYQADIIYGGRNLGEYIRRVQVERRRSGNCSRCDEVRRI